MGITRIARRATTVILVAAVVAVAVLISNQELDSTFATNGVNLKIDSRAFYNGLPVPSSTWEMKDLKPTVDKFFNLFDLKPGDSGKDIVSIHPLNAAAWSCLDFFNLKDSENGTNEPESEEDVNAGGELSDTIQVFGWRDDGDNVYEVGEKPLFNNAPESMTSALDLQSYTIRDSKSPDLCAPNVGCYAGIAWCFGNMDVNLATAEIACNGAGTGNDTQTDTATVDVAIRAVNVSQYPNYVCGGYVPEANTSLIKLFFDNFDNYPPSTNFDQALIHRWVETGGVQAVYGLDGKVADLDGGTNVSAPLHTEILTSKSLDFTNYHDIVLSYRRKSDDTNAPPSAVGLQTLKVEYSVNDGGSWTTLETVVGETLWTSRSFSLSPAVSGMSNVKIRFMLTGVDGTNHAYIDNVKIIGVHN